MTLNKDGTRTFSNAEKAKSRDEFYIFNPGLDSSDIDRQRQQEMLQWVYNFYRKNPTNPPGLVIKHGTDTMEEGALLSYQKLPMVIVLTGSWASAGEDDSDAALNLERAKRAAEVIPVPGVYAAIQDQVILASQLHKVQNHPWKLPQGSQKPIYPNSQIKSGPNHKKYNYFVSIHDQIFGRFDAHGTLTLNGKLLQEQKARLDAKPAFPMEQRDIPAPAYVEHVVFTHNTPVQAFNALKHRLESEKAPNGAVLEGEWFTRSDTLKVIREISELAANQHYVVSTDGSPTLKDRGFVVNTLPAFSLRAKLAALLSQNTNPFAVAKLAENHSGEIISGNIPKTPILRVPASFESHGEIVLVHPALTTRVIRNAVARLETLSDKSQNPILLLVGYGDGHLPIGNTAECFRLIESLRCNKANEQDVREQLIEKSPMLAAIAEAIKKGIEVRMGSKGDFLAPELGAYEIGKILKFIGVKPTTDAMGKICTTQQYLDRFNA